MKGASVKKVILRFFSGNDPICHSQKFQPSQTPLHIFCPYLWEPVKYYINGQKRAKISVFGPKKTLFFCGFSSAVLGYTPPLAESMTSKKLIICI